MQQKSMNVLFFFDGMELAVCLLNEVHICKMDNGSVNFNEKLNISDCVSDYI